MTTPDPKLVALARVSCAGLAKLHKGDWELTPHLRAYIEACEEAIRTAGRVLSTWPPRHGKTATTAYFCAWFLCTHPGKRVLLAAYNDVLASEMGSAVRSIVEECGHVFGVRLSPRSRASSHWTTQRLVNGQWRDDGTLYAVGVGGPATGRGADLLVIDDACKSAEDAYSEASRERIWNWVQSVALTRLEPGAAVLGIGTRWHLDDWIGRVLELEPGRWNLLHFPAIAEEDDQLGRDVGEPLWPSRYGLDALKAQQTSVGPGWWAAQYQGHPTPEDGSLFKAPYFKNRYTIPDSGYYQLGPSIHALATMRRFVVADVALSTKTRADWTVLGVFGIPIGSADLVLLDLKRDRLEAPALLRLLASTIEDWQVPAAYVEKAGVGLAVIQEARACGLPIRELEADRDKYSRALLATTLCEAGRLWLPDRAAWAEGFVAECLHFPVGRWDDQVDVLAYAARVHQDFARHAPGPIDLGSGYRPRRYSDAIESVGLDTLQQRHERPDDLFAGMTPAGAGRPRRAGNQPIPYGGNL